MSRKMIAASWSILKLRKYYCYFIIIIHQCDFDSWNIHLISMVLFIFWAMIIPYCMILNFLTKMFQFMYKRIDTKIWAVVLVSVLFQTIIFNREINYMTFNFGGVKTSSDQTVLFMIYSYLYRFRCV